MIITTYAKLRDNYVLWGDKNPSLTGFIKFVRLYKKIYPSNKIVRNIHRVNFDKL